jgi:hypothetical protein
MRSLEINATLLGEKAASEILSRYDFTISEKDDVNLF